MKIKTLNSNNEITYKTVTDVWATIVEQPRRLIVKLENGTTLRCSNNHPVMVQGAAGAEQVDAEHLTSQHAIITDTGTTSVVSITSDDIDTQYVDLSVEDTETFFTADTVDNDMVLTHNCSQGGLRGGSATGYYPWWHYEFPELIVLKNNSGTEESRERHIDYGVEINKFLFDKFVNNEDVTLFSPHEVPELKDAFYRGTNEDFARVYADLEQKPGIKKRVVSAKDMIYNIASERQKTGRIYINFIDNMMQQGPFEKLLPTQYLMSNLCVTGDTTITVNIDGEILSMPIEALATTIGCDNTVSVLSYDTETNQQTWSAVTAFGRTATNAEVLLIEDTESGRSIKCTPDHKILTKNRGYVMAKDLVETDELVIV